MYTRAKKGSQLEVVEGMLPRVIAGKEDAVAPNELLVGTKEYVMEALMALDELGVTAALLRVVADLHPFGGLITNISVSWHASLRSPRLKKYCGAEVTTNRLTAKGMESSATAWEVLESNVPDGLHGH